MMHTGAFGGNAAFVLGLFATVAAACNRPEPLNVVIVTFDTTRADHIGCYGNDHADTPNLDRLASEGVLFERAFTPIPITLPSHTSIMTGKVPFAHGVRDNGLFIVAEQQTTLAEVLKTHGYDTAASIGAFPLLSRFGLNQGFDLYDEKLVPEFEDLRGNRVLPKRRMYFDERRAAQVNEALIPWLDEHHEKPFFLWAHYFDPHLPHQPPAPFLHVHANDLYHGEIAYADRNLGLLIDHLKRLGVYERTVFVFTSDHGEGLGEHRETTHSLLVYNSTLHVPLIVRHPNGAAGRRIQRRVGTVDIMPTLLDALGIEIADDLQGESLLPFLQPNTNDPSNPAPPLYAETLSPRIGFEAAELRTIFDDRYKYIHGPNPELYDVETDHAELQNLIDTEPDRASRMKRALAQYLDDHAVNQPSAAVAMDEKTAERLRALGYLHAAGAVPKVGREVLREGGVPPIERVLDNNLLSRAKHFLTMEQPLAAKVSLGDLLDRAPDNAAYLNLLVEAEIQLGRLDEAHTILERISSMKQSAVAPTELLRRMAAIRYNQRRREDALQHLLQGEDLEPTAQGRYFISKIHTDLGKPELAFADLKAVLELDSSFAPALLDLAIRYAERGEIERAEESFNRALAEQPYHARSFYNYGAFLVQRGAYSEAAEHLERAIRLQPGYVLAYHSLARLMLDLNEGQKAYEVYSRMVIAAPEHPLTQVTERLVDRARSDGKAPVEPTSAEAES